MAFTSEQQARIDRFNAILQFASQQTGVVQVPRTSSVDLRLPDGTPRTEVTAVIECALLANWQPPQPETKDYPKDEDNENPLPVSANGAVPAQSE